MTMTMTEMMIMMMLKMCVITVNHCWQLIITDDDVGTGANAEQTSRSQVKSVYKITKKNTKWHTIYCYIVNTLYGRLILECNHRTIDYCLWFPKCAIQLKQACKFCSNILLGPESHWCYCQCIWCVSLEARWYTVTKCIVCQKMILWRKIVALKVLL